MCSANYLFNQRPGAEIIISLNHINDLLLNIKKKKKIIMT